MPLIPTLRQTHRFARAIWRRLSGRADARHRLLPSGLRETPLADLLDSMEAAAPPRRKAWWARFVFWPTGRRATPPKRASERGGRHAARMRPASSNQLAWAEPLEVRLALSTTSIDPLRDQQFAAADTSSPYVFTLGTSDLDLSAHAAELQGRDVVVVADETAGGALGDVVIGSLGGLESLRVEAPAGVIIHESLGVVGELSFAADVTFGGSRISLAAGGFDFGGPIIVSADVAMAGGPSVLTPSRFLYQCS